MKSIDISGEKFGRLTAIRIVARGGQERRDQKWLCRCECDGKEVVIDKRSLLYGNTRSGGCLLDESRSQNGKQNTTHGHSRCGNVSSEYMAWRGMRARCGNENHKHYKDYGGRGITVCERWAESFEAFLADMGLKPSPEHEIDRIQNDGNYEPGNCRWALPIEQANNKRNNRLFTIGDRTKTIDEWVRESSIDPDKLYRL